MFRLRIHINYSGLSLFQLFNLIIPNQTSIYAENSNDQYKSSADRDPNLSCIVHIYSFFYCWLSNNHKWNSLLDQNRVTTGSQTADIRIFGPSAMKMVGELRKITFSGIGISEKGDKPSIINDWVYLSGPRYVINKI